MFLNNLARGVLGDNYGHYTYSRNTPLPIAPVWVGEVINKSCMGYDAVSLPEKCYRLAQVEPRFQFLFW